MEKRHIDRRIEQMAAEGVTFHYGAHVGETVSAREILDRHDAIALAGGAEASRDSPVPGRELGGVHFAMDFLPQQNRRVSGEPSLTNQPILAAGKHVVVIGGGDTGSDCIGTSIRQGALKVTQLEILPLPPKHEDKMLTWPNWPLKLQDVVEPRGRRGARIRRDDHRLRGRKRRGDRPEVRPGRRQAKRVPGTEFTLKADLALRRWASSRR